MFFIIKLSRGRCWPAASGSEAPHRSRSNSNSSSLSLCCCFCGCCLHQQRRGLSSPWPSASGSEAPTAAGDSSSRIHRSSTPEGVVASGSEAPPAESFSSAYLSLSFALSIISLSTKALLLECSCKILLADELIRNVIVCVRPVAGLPVANRDPGVIFTLSIFIFLVVVLNDTRPWAGCRLFFARAGAAEGRARNYSSTITSACF